MNSKYSLLLFVFIYASSLLLLCSWRLCYSVSFWLLLEVENILSFLSLSYLLISK